MSDGEDAYLAGRLFHWGLQPHARPAQEEEYKALINRYYDRSDFREIVKEIARGLSIEILEVDEHGIILSPTEQSTFAYRPTDFRTSSSTDDRLLDGLIQVAIAATVFPHARDLDEDAMIARPPITIEDVDNTIRTLANRYEEKQRSSPDPMITEEGCAIEDSWQVFRRRVEASDSKDERQSLRTTRRLIDFAFERLRQFGCFIKDARSDPPRYQPTYRYQVQVRELAATRIYRAIVESSSTPNVRSPE